MSVTIYSDVGCPFAHRVTSFLTHLGVDFEQEVAPIGGPHSARVIDFGLGIPLYVDDQTSLTESRVMLEYLAERHGYVHAFPADTTERTRQAHAVALVDTVFAPLLFVKEPDSLERFERAAEVFESAVEDLCRPGLFTFQIAPLWHILKAVRPSSSLASTISKRPALKRWLDDAIQIESIATTAGLLEWKSTGLASCGLDLRE